MSDTHPHLRCQLDALAQLTGVTDIILVDTSGLLVAAQASLPPDDLHRIAAAVSMLNALTDGAARCWDSQTVLQTAVRGAGGYLVIVTIAPHLLATALATHECDLEQLIPGLCRLGAGLANDVPGGSAPGWAHPATTPARAAQFHRR